MNLLDKLFPASRTASRLEERAEVQRAFRKGVEQGRMEGRSVVWGASAIWNQKTNSGESVNEERSLGISAVYAAVLVLANTTASLPLKLYRRRGDGGKEEARNHPLYRVLHSEANPRMSAYKCRQAIMLHMLLWGNSYSELTTNGNGDVVELWPVNPRRVEIKAEGSRTVYRIWLPNGNYVDRGQERILHISNLGFDGVEGKSPITLHREALGITLAAEKYGAKFFKQDTSRGVYLKHPGKLSDTAYSHLKRDLQEQKGSADNAWKPWILEEGTDIGHIGLPPGDAQFIESREFGVLEVARIFNVPPHKLAELTRATFSNIEHQALEFVTQSLRDRLVNIEQEVNRRLLTEQEKDEFFAEHLVEGLLRGDQASRYEAYATARNWGWMSANDIRKLENMNPIEDGDTYLQPLNMVPAGEPPRSRISLNSDTINLNSRSDVREVRALPPRYRIAEGMLPMLRDTFDRANKREIAEIQNAVDRYLIPGNVAGFRTFLEDFEEEHSSWLMERGRIVPLFDTFARQMTEAAQDEVGGEIEVDEQFTRDYSEAYANRHSGSTTGQLRALLEEEPEEAVRQRLSEWEGDEENPSRAEKEANRERVRASNAFTKMAWALAGVSIIRWRTVGQNCPMCGHLDGRAVSITEFFVREGDEVPNTDGTDLTVRTNIGHPPIHRGCDCLLQPSLGRKALSNYEIRQVKRMILGQHQYHTNGLSHEGKNSSHARR